MFRKRIKKDFPPGTFIPMPARVFSILQLSVAILVLLWQLALPFMGDLFAVRSNLAIYEYVIGVSDGSHLRNTNAQRFAELPQSRQESIKNDYTVWQIKLQDSFWQKINRSIENVFTMPLFEKIWVLLSLLLPVLLLKKTEGASEAVWLIPLVVFAYAVDNRLNGAPSHLTPEQQLFPTEEYLLQRYSTEPLDPNPFKQRDQLQSSWQKYLVAEWVDQSISSLNESEKIALGEYAFSAARAEAINQKKPSNKTQDSRTALVGYLLWNIAFAYVATKYRQ